MVASAVAGPGMAPAPANLDHLASPVSPSGRTRRRQKPRERFEDLDFKPFGVAGDTFLVAGLPRVFGCSARYGWQVAGLGYAVVPGAADFSAVHWP